MEFLGRRKLALALIDDSEGLRPVDPAWVDGLAELFDREGQQSAIRVRFFGDNEKRKRIDGRHRLAAARKLGWDEIEVEEIRCTDDEARLIEVNENLARRDLSVLEEAVFLAEAKRIYNDQNKTGGRGGNTVREHKDILSLRSARFSDAEADGRKASAKTIDRRVKIGEVLGTQLAPDMLRALMASPHANDASGLMKLAKAPPLERPKLVQAVLRERKPARSLSEAISPPKVNVPVDLDDRQFEALVSAWRRNPRAKARQRFREWLATPDAAKAGLG